MSQQEKQQQQRQRQPQQQPRQVFPFRFVGVQVDDTNKALIQTSAGAGGSNDNSDKILSRKLNTLSLEERTRGIHELHGVEDVAVETAETIQERLLEMDTIVTTFAEEDTRAYHLALQQDREYVERIKLLCLKADAYDSHKAAARLVSFFTSKRSIFGDEKIAKDITLADLTDDDMAALKDGVVHLLQERDRAGRGIMMILVVNGSEHGAEASFRNFFYTCMLALRDPEIQDKGLVIIMYAVGQKKFHSDRPGKFARMMWFLPIRIVAVHYCYDRPLMNVFINVLSHAMESYHVCRFRGHFGTYLECAYNLLTYGIPGHVLPLNMENGAIDLQSHHEWIETQKKREALDKVTQQTKQQQDDTIGTSSSSVSREILVPGPLDIVSGRGRKGKKKLSPGYLRLQNLIATHSNAFDEAEVFEKMVVADLVLKEFRTMGCRFVKLLPDGYVEETDEVCRKKISEAFRNRRKNQRKKSADKPQAGARKRGNPEA